MSLIKPLTFAKRIVAVRDLVVHRRMNTRCKLRQFLRQTLVGVDRDFRDFCLANHAILHCVFECCCIFCESVFRHLQMCGVGDQLVLIVKSNVLLLSLQGNTECRVPEPVQRLSDRSSWHSVHHGVVSEFARWLECDHWERICLSLGFCPGLLRLDEFTLQLNNCSLCCTGLCVQRHCNRRSSLGNCRVVLQTLTAGSKIREGAVSLSSSATMLTDFLVIVVITVLVGLVLLNIWMIWFVSLSYPVKKVNHDFHPELNQGPADLQSAAPTMKPPRICIQSNKHRPHLCTGHVHENRIPRVIKVGPEHR